MRKQALLLIVICTTISCSSEAQTETIQTESNNDSSIINPTALFLEFVEEIESDGWFNSPERVEKVGLYSLQEVPQQKFNERPFYNIPFNKSQVFYSLKGSNLDSEGMVYSTFFKASQIWGYFYRDIDGEGMISDGLIEQWTFTDTTQAQLVYNYFKKHGRTVYFNTMPYFYLQGMNVYVFHTRAMAFSYDQKPLFEKFVLKMEAAELNDQ